MTPSERKEPKPRKCRSCGTKFVPDRPFVVWCSPECAHTLALAKLARAKELKAKKARKEHKEAKERIKSRGDWTKEAQAAFNAFIRKRDEDLPCVSCGTMTGQRHASHFYATSIRPNLRFDEMNVHASCAQCNKWMHGNLIPYRVELIRRIGESEINRLDSDIDPKHYSISDLKEIKALYKKKAKEL